MKAKEVFEHFREIGHWVNWGRTCDEFLHGDPDREVAGIGTTWVPTNAVLKQAAQKGLDLVVTHEGPFYPVYEGLPSAASQVKGKRELLDESGIVLVRCHDTWDRMPEVGIPDAWAEFLGFDTEPRPVESFYKTCLLGNITVEEAAARILEKTRTLGQAGVLILGDRNRMVNRMVVGTGAITWLPAMCELKPDVILATDDGMNTECGAHWATDAGVPIIVVNHATAEKPGMQAMARHLAKVFPDVPVEYLDVRFPFTVLK